VKIWFQNRRYKTKRRQLQQSSPYGHINNSQNTPFFNPNFGLIHSQNPRHVTLRFMPREEPARSMAVPLTLPTAQYLYHPYLASLAAYHNSVSSQSSQAKICNK